MPNTTALYYRNQQRVSYKRSPSNTKKPQKARTEQRTDARHIEKVQKQIPPSSSNNINFNSSKVFVITLAFTTIVTPVYSRVTTSRVTTSRVTTPSSTQISNSKESLQPSNNTQNNQTSSENLQSSNNTQNATVASVNTTQSSSPVVLQPYVPANEEEECKSISSSTGLCDALGMQSENIADALNDYKESFISNVNNVVQIANYTLKKAKEYSERSFEEIKQQAEILQDYVNATIKNTMEFINNKTDELQLKVLVLAEKAYNRSKAIQNETMTVVNKSRNALNDTQDTFEESKQNLQSLFFSLTNVTNAQDKKNKGTIKQYIDDEVKSLTNRTKASILNKFDPIKIKTDDLMEKINKTKSNLENLKESMKETNYTQVVEELKEISNSSSAHQTKELIYKITNLLKMDSEGDPFLWIAGVLSFSVVAGWLYIHWKSNDIMKEEKNLELDSVEHEELSNHIEKEQCAKLKKPLKEIEKSVGSMDKKTMISFIIELTKLQKDLEKLNLQGESTQSESTQNSALQVL